MRYCFYHTDLQQKAEYFTTLQYKLHSFNIQDDRGTRGLLAKPLKKFRKSPIRPAGSHFCSLSCCRVFEWTLIKLRSNIIKNSLCLFFYLMVLSLCTIFKSVWYARHFKYSCKRSSLNDWRQTAQPLKLQERPLTINRRNIIRWNILYRGNNFYSRRQVLKCL